VQTAINDSQIVARHLKTQEKTIGQNADYERQLGQKARIATGKEGFDDP